jgi:N-carbamoylputrescine amidase
MRIDQAKHAGPTDVSIDEIKRANIEKHLAMIDDAAKQGVQILCMQEVFTTPYFCAEQQVRWYEAVEKIPDGPTTTLMQETAKKHNMVIIVPIYEEEIAGIYYNTAAVIDADGKYLGKYQASHSASIRASGKILFQARNPRFPAFDTAYAKVRSLYLL